MIACGGATGTGLTRYFPLCKMRYTFLGEEDINSGASGGRHELLHNRLGPLPLVVVI